MIYQLESVLPTLVYSRVRLGSKNSRLVSRPLLSLQTNPLVACLSRGCRAVAATLLIFAERFGGLPGSVVLSPKGWWRRRHRFARTCKRMGRRCAYLQVLPGAAAVVWLTLETARDCQLRRPPSSRPGGPPTRRAAAATAAPHATPGTAAVARSSFRVCRGGGADFFMEIIPKFHPLANSVPTSDNTSPPP